MAEKTPKLALDAFLKQLRRAIGCIAEAEVRGSGYALGKLQSITLIPRGGGAKNAIHLRTTDGHRDILLAVYHQYTVGHLPGDPQRGPYKVSSAYYSYELTDREWQEILVYQWHPEGVSDITAPHLHVPRTVPIPLAQTSPPRAVALGGVHLPTGRILLEDLVETLIRDMGVEPRRRD